MTNLSAINSGKQTNRSDATAILALTGRGTELAARVSGQMPGSICFCNSRYAAPGMSPMRKMSETMASVWSRFNSIICIMGCGIVVRSLAPLLDSKLTDPAVVVLDEGGKFAISLVSGHLGGANELARRVAGITGGQAVITTASDLQDKIAVDLIAAKAGLRIENPRMLSRTAAAVLDEEPLWIYDPGEHFLKHLPAGHRFQVISSGAAGDRGGPPPAPNAEEIRHVGRAFQPAERWQAGKPAPHMIPFDLKSTALPPAPPVREGEPAALPARREGHTAMLARGGELISGAGEVAGNLPRLRAGLGIWVSETIAPPRVKCLKLRPPSLVLGIGCNRGTSAEEIIGLIEQVLRESGLSPLSIRNFASVDLKSDEIGLIEAVGFFKSPIVFFKREEIQAISVPNPSSTVARHIGVESVCEASAMLSAGSRNLQVPKRKSKNCTLAIARVSCS